MMIFLETGEDNTYSILSVKDTYKTKQYEARELLDIYVFGSCGRPYSTNNLIGASRVGAQLSTAWLRYYSILINIKSKRNLRPRRRRPWPSQSQPVKAPLEK
eukprot:TRINITY_DN8816_c0_g4_i2.p1 TRINITY_DN8816_c0_g4~~TRINITY_DN8816_c0_g4_i2.p1  ORF type:complete len:102 (-),score=10.24 TRINITY_DN8816_c0_g4_i2:432-737(-)